MRKLLLIALLALPAGAQTRYVLNPFTGRMDAVAVGGSAATGTPYAAPVVGQSTLAVTNATHGQGLTPVASCFDGSGNYVVCAYSVGGTGTVTFTWSPAFTGSVMIGNLSSGATGATGPQGPALTNGMTQATANDTDNAVPVAVGTSGRAYEKTVVTIDPTTGAISTPGGITSGVGSGAAGFNAYGAGTAPAFGASAGQIPTAGYFGWMAPAAMTSSLMLAPPNADPAANQVMLFGAASGNKAAFTWANFASTALTDTAGIVRGAAALTTDHAYARVSTTDGTLEEHVLVAADIPATPLSIAATTHTMVAPREYFFCTTATACSVTLPVPAAGYEFCVRSDNNVSTAITLAARTSIYYEKTDRSGWGSSGGTLVSGAAITNQVCVVGYDATHYAVMSSVGTWTAN